MNPSDQDPHLRAAHHRAEALTAAIEAAEAAAIPRIPPSIAALGEAADPSAALKAIEEAGLAEEALDWIRTHHRGPSPLRALLDPLAAKAKARRASRIHLEGNRVLARARYSKEGPALIFGTPDLQTLFGEVLRMEGLPLELDLGKRPRPLVACAPPLPFDVAGDCEWLEVHLRQGTSDGPETLRRINRRLPEGIRLLDWDEQPVWATPVAELCRSALWAWPCEDTLAPARIAAFLAADSFFLEKVGKVEGQKKEKRLDLRPLVLDMGWEGDLLRFTTLLGPSVALNPLKLLGAVLGRPPESIKGLRRTGFGMAEDTRLKKGDRFTSKLKNMYEDAVLLGASSNITFVEEDDDEPLTLG